MDISSRQRVPDDISSGKDINSTISTKLSTEQLICKTPCDSPATSIKALRQSPVVKEEDREGGCGEFTPVLYLGTLQILLGIFMAVFGVLVIVHKAKLAQVGTLLIKIRHDKSCRKTRLLNFICKINVLHGKSVGVDPRHKSVQLFLEAMFQGCGRVIAVWSLTSSTSLGHKVDETTLLTWISVITSERSSSESYWNGNFSVRFV